MLPSKSCVELNRIERGGGGVGVGNDYRKGLRGERLFQCDFPSMRFEVWFWSGQ